jgi:hypothetical protein
MSVKPQPKAVKVENNTTHVKTVIPDVNSMANAADKAAIKMVLDAPRLIVNGDLVKKSST